MHQITVWMRAPYLSLLTTQYKIHILCMHLTFWEQTPVTRNLLWPSGYHWLSCRGSPQSLTSVLAHHVWSSSTGFSLSLDCSAKYQNACNVGYLKNTSIYIVNLTYILACISSIFRSRKSSESLGYMRTTKIPTHES